MPNIDSNAYKVLKKLSKSENSRHFTQDETYWFGYLHKRGLIAHTFIKIETNSSLGTYVISKAGLSFIKDHKKRTLISFLKWFIPIFIVLPSVTLAVLTLLGLL